MAEYAANITSAKDVNPSIFEVLAQEGLMATLRPAAKHLFKVLAESNPERYGWTFRYSDELYTLIDLLIQYHSLKEFGASFSENFYNLRRISGADSGDKLSPSLRARSLALVVLVPYVKNLLDRKFSQLRQQQADGLIDPKKDAFLSCFVRVYPYAHALLEGTCLAFALSYALGRSLHHSPWIRLSGTRLVLATAAAAASTEDDATGGLCGRLAPLLTRSLTTGVFFLQFLGWWYQTRGGSEETPLFGSPTSIVAPPALPDAAKGAHSQCPVCGKERTNEVVLSTTGYVFCLPCIHVYLERHGKCPVTGFPSSTRHLLKIYPPSSH